MSRTIFEAEQEDPSLKFTPEQLRKILSTDVSEKEIAKIIKAAKEKGLELPEIDKRIKKELAGISTRHVDTATFIAKLERSSKYYKLERQRAWENLEEIAKLVKLSAKQISLGKPIGHKLKHGITIGSPGTNMIDLARACLKLKLNFDFTKVAKQYDDARPWNVSLRKDRAFKGKEGREAKQTAELNDRQRYIQRVASMKVRVKAEGENRFDYEQFIDVSDLNSMREVASRVGKETIKFLDKIWPHIVTNFEKQYPEDYYDFLTKEHQNYRYSSESPDPISLGALIRRTRETDQKEASQLTGYSLFEIIKSMVDETQFRLTQLDSDSQDSNNTARIVNGIVRELNNKLSQIDVGGTTYKVFDITIRADIAEGLASSDIVEQVDNQLDAFLVSLGQYIIRLYQKHPRSDTVNDIIKELKEYCSEPLEKRAKNLMNKRIAYSFDLDHNGVQPSYGEEFFHLSPKGTEAKVSDKSRLLNVHFDKTRNDGLEPMKDEPNVNVVFQYQVDENKYSAVQIEREEVYSRKLEEIGTINVSEVTPELVELIRESVSLVGEQFEIYKKIMEYKTQKGSLQKDLENHFSLNKSVKEAAASINRVLPITLEIECDESTFLNNLDVLAKKYLMWVASPGSPYKGGCYPVGVINVDNNGNMEFMGPKWSNNTNPAYIPIFYTMVGRPYSAPSGEYQQIKEERPWPVYASDGDYINPDKKVRVDYHLDGEAKSDVLKAVNIWERGLDRPSVQERLGLEHVEFNDLDQTPGEDELPTEEVAQEELVFYTRIDSDYSGSFEMVSCNHCSNDNETIQHPNYPQLNNAWDTRLTSLRGRYPNEIVKFTYTTDGQRNSVILRRHELLERSQEIFTRDMDYNILPYSEDEAVYVYVIIKGQLRKRKLGDDEIEAAEELKNLKRVKAEAEADLAAGRELDESSQKLIDTIFPESIDDSLDIGDHEVSEEIEEQTPFFDPIKDEYRRLDPKIVSDSQTLYDSRVELGQDGKIPTKQDREWLWLNPDVAGDFREWLEVRGNDLFVVLPPNKKLAEELQKDEDERIITVEKDYSGIGGFDNKNQRYLLVEYDKNNVPTVNYPWVYKYPPEVKRIYKQSFDPGEQGIIDKILPAPVDSPEEIIVKFQKRGSKPQELKFGEHYTFVDESDNRRLLWTGKLKDQNDEPIGVDFHDAFIISYQSAGSYYMKFEQLPLQRAVELAARTWQDYKQSRKMLPTTKTKLNVNLDFNGQGSFSKSPTTKRRQSFEHIANHLSETEKLRWTDRVGKLKCGNRILSKDGIEISCPNEVAHTTYPSVVLLEQPSRAFITPKGKLKITPPSWRWVSRTAIAATEASAKIRNWLPDREEVADVIMKYASAAKSRNQEYIDPTLNYGQGLRGYCNSCWMYYYDIVPKQIIENMWEDLSRIASLSDAYLGDKSVFDIEELGSGYEKEAEALEEQLYNVHLKNPIKLEGEEEEVSVLEGWRHIESRIVKTKGLMANWAQEWIKEHGSGMRVIKHITPSEKKQQLAEMATLRVLVTPGKRGLAQKLVEYLKEKLNKALDKPADFKSKLTRGSEGEKLLVINHDPAFGPRNEKVEVFRNPETKDILRIEEDDIERMVEVGTTGRGYESHSGKLYLFNLDIGPVVGYIVEENDEEIILKITKWPEESEEQPDTLKVSREMVGEPTELNENNVKLLIYEKLAEFFANYLSNKSFWYEIRKYLLYEVDGMPESIKSKLISRLISWRETLEEEFGAFSEDKMADTLIEKGVEESSGRPWFSLAIERMMRMIGNLYFWTQYLKNRYATRTLDEFKRFDHKIQSIMSLTRLAVRDRNSYGNALRQMDKSKPKTFRKAYHKELAEIQKGLRESWDHESEIVIYGANEDYLNGLTGIVESKTKDGHYIVNLDPNDILIDSKIMLERNEFAYFISDSEQDNLIVEASEDEDEYESFILEEVEKEQNKDEIINLISEFTSEYPFWD